MFEYSACILYVNNIYYELIIILTLIYNINNYMM